MLAFDSSDSLFGQMTGHVAQVPSPFQGWLAVDPPEGLCLTIFSFLPLNDLCTALLVNRIWNHIAKTDALWMRFLPERVYRPPGLSSRLFVLRHLIKRNLWDQRLDRLCVFNVVLRRRLKVNCMEYCYPQICLGTSFKEKKRGARIHRLYLIHERTRVVSVLTDLSEPSRFMRTCGASLLAVGTAQRVQVWNLKHGYCRGESIWSKGKKEHHQLDGITTVRERGSSFLSCIATNGEQRVFRLLPIAGGQVKLVASGPAVREFRKPTKVLSTDIQVLADGRLLALTQFGQPDAVPTDRHWVIRLWSGKDENSQMTYEYVGQISDIYEGLCSSNWFVLRQREDWWEQASERLCFHLSYLALREGGRCDMAYKRMTFNPASGGAPGVGSGCRFLPSGRPDPGMKKVAYSPFNWRGAGEYLLLTDRRSSTLQLFGMEQGGFSKLWDKPFAFPDLTSHPLTCERRGPQHDSACLGLFLVDPQSGQLHLISWGQRPSRGPPIVLGD